VTARSPGKAAASKPAATTKRAPASVSGERPASDDPDERPGPADAHSATFWYEIRRAFIWVCVVGAAALVVILIEPILFIMGSVVIAVMLDGGTRLLGRVLPIPRSARLAIVTFAVFAFVLWTIYLTGTQVSEQAAQLPTLIETQVARINAWAQSHGINLGLNEAREAGRQLLGSVGRVTAALSTAPASSPASS
jgi:predicted PurR-regulated permease PerM